MKKTSPRPFVHAYCDGACKGNPGPGGWGTLFFHVSEKSDGVGLTPSTELSSKAPTSLVFRNFGGKPRTTNSEMELLAFLETLKLVPKGSRMEIHTDSKYVFNAMVKTTTVSPNRGTIAPAPSGFGWLSGWIKNDWVKSGGGNVMYPEHWKKIVTECELHLKSGSVIGVNWVKGHAGNEGNEMADELANMGVPRVLLEHTDPGSRENHRGAFSKSKK